MVSRIFVVTALLGACIATSIAGCKRQELHPQTAARRSTDASALVPVKVISVPANLASALTNKHREPISVTVLSSAQTHGFTWLRVKDESAQCWVAAPMLSVPVGAVITLSEYVASQQIDPDVVPGHIDTVLFAASVSGERVKLYQTGEHAAVHPLLPAGGVTPTDLDIEMPKIEKADHDIGELHVRRDELHGQIMAIRAQVVRVTPTVIGRHFVFLRDGSGDKHSSILPAMVDRPTERGAVLLMVGRFWVGRRFLHGGVHPLIFEHARVVETTSDIVGTRDELVAYLAANATPIDVVPMAPQATAALDSPSDQTP